MIKLLILGSGNINPINILCKNLREYGSYVYQIDGLNLYKKGLGGVNTDYQFLDHQIEISQELSIHHLPKKLWLRYIKENFSIRQLINLFIESKLNCKWLKLQIEKAVLHAHYRLKLLEVIKEYDIINIQYLSDWQSDIVPLIPSNIRVVVSIWGSDLMDTAGKDIYNLQYDALQRADAITIVGQEMEEILLSKFGRNLKSKVHYALYGLLQEKVDAFLNEKEKLKEVGYTLLKDHGFDLAKYRYIIKMGYNALESQNHIQLLKEMAKLPNEILNQTLIILPMTYGLCEDSYKEKVEELIKTLKINGVVLKKYLTDEQSKSISVISNIMFNLRNNDAFNNSMTESLLSGGIVFNGSWLPYKMLKQKGTYYIEVYNLDELSVVFANVISNFEKHKEKTERNALILNGYICGKENIDNWEKALLPDSTLMKHSKHLLDNELVLKQD